MRRYGEKILHALLDKYENSLLYRGENKRNQTIGFAVKKSTLPEYFDETSQEYAVIHAQLWELEDKGFLLLHWKDGKEGHILERCTLQAEQVSGAYEFLSRYPKREIYRSVQVFKRHGDIDVSVFMRVGQVPVLRARHNVAGVPAYYRKLYVLAVNVVRALFNRREERRNALVELRRNGVEIIVL